MNEYPPIITEDYWANSPLSVVRHTGSIRFLGQVYTIVDKNGVDVFTLSRKAAPGQSKVIAPGEPCDLCHSDWLKVYRALGRDKILELVKEGKTLKEVRKIVRELKTKPK